MSSLTTKLRILTSGYNKLASLTNLTLKQSRPSSYRSSAFVEDLGNINVKYEVTKDPEDWKYVERLFAPMIVPEPVPKDSYPSEWKPQAADLKDQPYFIQRTKNHMIPVYLNLTYRGTRKVTIVRKIHGDIYLLEKELREFLQKTKLRPIRSQVNEFIGQLSFHGDYVNAIKYWLLQRNF